MNHNTFIRLLLFSFIAFGILYIVCYFLPSKKSDNLFTFEAVYSPEAETMLEDIGYTTNADYETPETDESLFEENEEDIFVIDVWMDKISDYVAKVQQASDEKQSENENDIADKDDKADEDNSENIFETNQSERTTSVIIDTDFASDADDIIAVRLAMCFQDVGMLDIKGIALSTTYSRSPLAIHALCKQDGYGNIPVAMETSGNGIRVHTNYIDVMYDMPKSRNDYEQPVQMYRRILSESNTKVNIITLGFLQNIQGLMNSFPDQYSNLTGAELISEKVDTLYVVGGNSTDRPSFNFYWTGSKVIKAAQDVSRNFPAKIVFLQTDLSDDTFCGQFYNVEDSRQQDIVTRALKANDQSGGVVAWDVFSVWCAVQDMNGNLEQCFLEIQQGSQYISDTGATEWTPNDFSNQYKINKKVEGAYYSELLNNMLREKYNKTHRN